MGNHNSSKATVSSVATKSSKRRDPSSLTPFDRRLMEEQRQQMYYRDVVDNKMRQLDEDSQMCQEYYASSPLGRRNMVDLDAIVDML